MKISAILYDLDGTLADCCDWHYLAFNKALKEIANYEINYEDHINNFNGIPTKKKLELLLNRGVIYEKDFKDISIKKQQYTEDIINPLLPRRNIQQDLIKIKLHQYNKNIYKIKSGCVSNSIKSTINNILHHTGQLQYMDCIISNEDVRYPKPSPECYINAMVKLQVYPYETIIVEDSPVGIKAAEASTAYVWKIAGSHEVTLTNFLKFIENI
jgi:beta-phosphoglucomutase